MDKERAIIIEDVFPADVYIRLVISAKGLNKLLDYLNASTLEYDGIEQPELKEADIFVKEEFFPLLNNLTEKIKAEKDGT